jgi:poly(A) polymerase
LTWLLNSSTTSEKMSAESAAQPIAVPEIITRSDHRISRRDIDPDALKVLYRLHRHGHIAYLVGGGVRDLLLKRNPKDFDISTSAHPNEIKKLFSNCRLIGKRFRLAHIYFRQGKIIEVSTFRKISEFTLDEGPIISDNTFGTPAEDAFRRDFSINALFYNIADFTVIDYVGGLADLHSRVLRCIGDPMVRFKEDPIRMLRGVRFASLLDFSIDEESTRTIRNLRHDIWEGATPRILEEILRMFTRGTGSRAMALLKDVGLLESVFPEIHRHIQVEGISAYSGIIARMDHQQNRGREFSSAIILAAFMYPYCRYRMEQGDDSDLLKLVREILSPMAERIQIPRRMRDTMRQAIAAQHRLFALKEGRYKPGTLLRKSYFDDALTLFELAAGGTEEGRKLIRDWKNLKGGEKNQQPRRRNRRRKRRVPDRKQ